MRNHFPRNFDLTVFFILICFFSSTQAKIIPKNLNSSDQKFLLPFFSDLYTPQYPSIPYFMGNYPGLEIGVTTSWKHLRAVQERFPSDSIEEKFLLSQLYIKKTLTHRLEVGLSTTLSSFDTTSSSTGFGGHVMWHPKLGVTAFIQPIISFYTLFLNFEDTLSTQESGIHFSIGKIFSFFSINTGLSLTHYSGQFEASSQGRSITTSGQKETESMTSQNFFGAIQFGWNQLRCNFIQSYNTNKSWTQSLILSYSL